MPQIPSTLLHGGAFFMVNESGILLSFDPATAALIKQGRLKGAIDKYVASPVGADGKVFLNDEVFATPSWKLATGSWRLGAGRWRLEAGS